jgi:hypothetical protein
MLLASFTLTNPANAGFDADIAEKLQQLSGVSDVLIGGANDTCSIVYDEAKITTLTLRNALHDAGYDSRLDEKHVAKSASCCGNCS